MLKKLKYGYMAGVGLHVTQNVDTVPSEIMRFVPVKQSFGQELVELIQFISSLRVKLILAPLSMRK